MSNGGRQEGASSSHRSSPIPRGPSTPTSSSPFSDLPRAGQSILAGRYTIGRELGRGANGRVFSAFDQQEGRFVAVKRISLVGVSKEQLNGVIGEIDLLKNLDHENIVQYYDSIKTNNHLYIILEFMESGSLAGVIKQTNYGAFSERWVALYVAQVLKGLKYLHAQGVVHRDIKGANILTTKDMVIKLADFGVAAKLADRGSKGTEEESDKTVAGSPYWMAPEVIELSSVTTAADIWSIGCLIVELLTGSAPYFDCQPLSALFRIVQDKHPPLPQGISVSLRSFLLSCFIKDPIKRPTAEDLLRHEWITENQEGSVSPNKMTSMSSSPAPSASLAPSSRSVVERILQHKMSTRTSKPSSDQTSEVEPATSPERTDSPLAMSRSSSAAINEIQPADVTDADEDNYERLRRRVSADKEGRFGAANPQSLRSSTDKDRVQSRNGSAAHSDTSTTIGRKKDWREDAQTVDKDATSMLMTTESASVPDVRASSPAPAGNEQSALVAIFSDRVYGAEMTFHSSCCKQCAIDFETDIYRARTGESWDVYCISQPGSCCEQYDPSNIRTVLAQLQPHLPLTSILPALRDLTNLMRHDVEAKSIFVHTDGLLTLLELLLQFDDLVVVEQTLFLANCVCENDSGLLKDAASIGLAGEIFKFADIRYPLTVRSQTAHFLRSMTFSSVKSRDSLIQCQGLKHLVVLLDDGERKSLELKETAVVCLEQIIESNGPLEKKLLRMLCMADLLKHLSAALASIHQHFSQLSLGGAPMTPEAFPAPSGGLTGKSSFSADSGSEPCIPGTPSEISSCPEHRRESSETSMSVAGYNNPEASDSMRLTEANNPAPVQILSDRIMNLFLKVSMSESEVHGHFFRPGTLQKFLSLLRLPPKDVIHKVVVCLKHLSQKPPVVEHLQGAGTIGQLVPLLGQRERSEVTTEIQREALIVIDTICKCSPQWREKAVRHGIVPYLCNLSRSTVHTTLQEPRNSENDVRNLSVPLLCRLLLHCSPFTRQIFWEHDVVNLFIELLDEEKWHQVVLDALATWLEEDIHQVEEKLVSDSSVQNLIAILRGYRYRSSNEISAVLDPLLRMLLRSDRLSRTAGQSGLAQVILDMLKEADAATCLRLLKSLRRIYGMHPRPKEFINRYGVQKELDHLANSAAGDSVGDARVLVRKEALDLLKAFQMNQIW